MQECMKYISFLNIPNGIEIDVISITDTKNIAAGYNAAMKESDAKYKVYLHQNTFILYKNFIQDVLDLFKKNPEYGLLGVLGRNSLLKDANYQDHWNIGMSDYCNSLSSTHLYLKNSDEIEPVHVIDGMIMITQYDVLWQEETFKGFDFYNVSQSIEFQKLGYKVGVPHQKTTWCIYDYQSKNIEKYDDARKIFCQKYKNYGYQYIEHKENKEQKTWNYKVKELMPTLEETILSGQIEKAKNLIDKIILPCNYNTKICILQMLCKIILQEKVLKKNNSFIDITNSLQEIIEQLLLYKFLLRRLEYDKSIEDLYNVIKWIAQYEDESLTIIKIIAEYTNINLPKVIWKLSWFLENYFEKTLNIHIEHKDFSIPNEAFIIKALPLCKLLQTNISKLSNTIYNQDEDFSLLTLESIYSTIEEITSEIYIVGWCEKFYKTYLDVITYKKNLEIFLVNCQNWLKQVMNYLQQTKKQPLISVVLSVYNGEAFVKDTLMSIIKQSYKNLQIIIVDDCSTDNSREIIDEIAEQDKRINKIYLKENSNVCIAVNTGCQKATGKYLAFIGHDDIWKSDKLEKQYHFMEMNPEYGVCFTLCDIIDDKKQICNEKCQTLYQTFQQKNRSQKDWIHILFFLQNVFCAPSAFVRKECITWEPIFQNNLLQLQDYALWLDISINFPFYILQEKLTLYRQFLKKDFNLSTLNEDTGNRTYHETKFIQKRFLQNISNENFLKYFQRYFTYESAYTLEELNCEKAFLLKKANNFYCLDIFIELLETEYTRNILKNIYHFQLNDFYKLNAIAFPYNYSESLLRNNLALANQYLQQYKKIIEEQKQQIEELKQRK